MSVILSSAQGCGIGARWFREDRSRGNPELRRAWGVRCVARPMRRGWQTCDLNIASCRGARRSCFWRVHDPDGRCQP